MENKISVLEALYDLQKFLNQRSTIMRTRHSHASLAFISSPGNPCMSFSRCMGGQICIPCSVFSAFYCAENANQYWSSSRILSPYNHVENLPDISSSNVST